MYEKLHTNIIFNRNLILGCKNNDYSAKIRPVKCVIVMNAHFDKVRAYLRARCKQRPSSDEHELDTRARPRGASTRRITIYYIIMQISMIIW